MDVILKPKEWISFDGPKEFLLKINTLSTFAFCSKRVVVAFKGMTFEKLSELGLDSKTLSISVLICVWTRDTDCELLNTSFAKVYLVYPPFINCFDFNMIDFIKKPWTARTIISGHIKTSPQLSNFPIAIPDMNGKVITLFNLVFDHEQKI